ncbi:tetratricopeptide repeat protein [Phyllobacterium trifolii]|uniref:tetratricopeptide repeat protein n=1 Tax=Phyllobacterium trifolii TaxID=300193 RepID=UPI0016077114
MRESQFNLGVMYQLGEEVAQSYELAAKWYNEAAELGDPLAQCNLARLYLDGSGDRS